MGLAREIVGRVPWLDTMLKAGRLPMGAATRANFEALGGARIFEQVGQQYGIHPALLFGVARKESNFDPNAIGPGPIYAKGLMQLTDDTRDRFGVQDWADPLANLRGGARDLIAKGIKTDKELGDVLAGYGGFVRADPTGYINAVCRFATWGWAREGVGEGWPLQLTAGG